MKKLNIIIGNKYKGAAGTYIGRGSPLGNPFPIDETKGNTRNKVIEQYEVWLRDQIKRGINKPLLNQLNSIANEAIHTGSCTIVCFCIQSIANQLNQGILDGNTKETKT